MTNEELLQQYKDSDASALEQLYEQNVGLIKRTAEKCLMDFGYLSKDTTTPWKAASYVDELRQELCGEGALVFLNEIQSGTYDPSQGKLTTYLYPFIRGAMYRWLEKQRNEIVHTVSVCDLMPNGAENEPIEFPDMQSQSVDQIVYQKICFELLRDIFDQLSEKDRSILGHTFGVYGYKKYTLDELGLKEILTVDGVIKARDAALLRLQKLYDGSQLQLWISVYRILSAL